MKLERMLAKNRNLYISLTLSAICMTAGANTITTASTTTTTASTTPTTVSTASTTPAPAKSAATTSTTITTPTAPTAPVAPAAATSTVAPKKEEAPKASFGIAYEAGYSMQAQTQPNGTRSQSISHGFTPSMSYGLYSARVNFSYEQDLNDSASNGFGDPAFTFGRKGWELGKYLKLGPSASLVLPMTDESKNNVGLMYNIGGALSLSLNTKAIGMDSLSLSYQLAANKNFTNYDTKADGSINNSHKLRNRLSLGYQITDAVSFFNMFDFNSSYSVNGVVTNSYFSLQSFGYSVNDNVSLSLSHALGGSYLKAGTYENNLKFFDSKASNYSFGVEISL